MSRQLPIGAQVTPVGTRFRVWAPDARSVDVVLFQAGQAAARHALHAEDGGYWQAEFGGDARGGVTFLFTPGFGVFIEGRYTAFSTNPGGQNTDFDVQTFHALGGFTLRW